MKNRIFLFNVIFFVFLLLAAFSLGLVLVKSSMSAPAAAQVTTESEEDKTPPILFNIRVGNINATSSIITWETDELSDSLVNYGLDKSYGVVREPRADKTVHEIIVENLLPGTNYFFRVTSSDGNGNQGISSDYSFTTAEIEIEEKKGPGLAENILEAGEGGLSEKGVEELLQAIEKISNEEILEQVDEAIKKKAEEVVTPPTIILDTADVEVGTDYAIIPWKTDKESNSMVALAEEREYDPDSDNPYVWNEGDPEELVLEHRVEVRGLKPATVYHFQVSSKSELGLTGVSSDKTFKTKSILPEIFNLQIVKIEEESATIRWVTNVPCSSIVKYTNLNTNETKLEGNSSFLTIHNIKLSSLIFDTYYSVVVNVESEEGEKAESEPLTFITIKDEYPPVVSKVNTESTLYPGTENKIQTIASWETDEEAQCQLFYHQGLVLIDEPSSLQKEQDLAMRHVQVVTNFLPSTVYKFWIVCNDEAGNSSKSEDFTMLTPTQEESIIDIILKNFESSFGWVKKLKI
jgi:hypothetical protein